MMKEKPEIRQVDLVKQTGLSRASIVKNIAWLKENGYLIRQGSDRKGRWIVLEGNDPADKNPDQKS